MTEQKFEVVDDYTVKYDRDYFDLHKPSDVRSLVTVANYIVTENEQLKQSEKENLKITIDEKILKAQTDVEDLKKDAYEKGYSFNPYFYWGIEIGLQRLKEEFFEK